MAPPPVAWAGSAPADGAVQMSIRAMRQRSGASRFRRSVAARRVVPVIQNEREYAMKIDATVTNRAVRAPLASGALQ
jgi:dihydropteroate synthase